MGFFYTAYGLNFESDSSLPGLKPLPTPLSTTDLHIYFTIPVPREDFGWSLYSFAQQNSDAHIFVSRDEQYFQLRYPDGVQFTLNPSLRKIWTFTPPAFGLEYVVSYLTNPVLALWLRLHKHVCLHASAIVIENKAVLFCGSSGYGKSTTAFYFASQGHAVLSDDVSVLDKCGDEIWVRPGYPHLRLWSLPDDQRGDILQPIAPGWRKQYVNIERYFAFQSASIPLGAIYVLWDSDDQIRIQAPSPIKVLMILTRNIYNAYLKDPTLSALDFKLLTSLVGKVPVKLMIFPEDLSRLNELYDSVLRDYHLHTPLKHT